VILKEGDIVLHPSGLPWFVWTAAALLPFGAAADAHKFYRNHRGSLILWTRVAVLALVQVALFLLSFAFFPRLAFVINIVALPFGYHLLDSNLKDRGIERNLKGRVF
jgi:hypothetical protein